jgi:hypothetical protein
MTQPTVGRMVYYKTRGSADGVYPPKNFAAIVTDTHLLGDTDGGRDTVDLVTFGPNGSRYEHNVEQGEGVGQWDWMPFQKDQQARLAPGTANDSHVTSETENK